ncbi:MAG: TRAP transporter small permease [Proteobacteria bacterium]|nr:TRAP transporter small permease [Pseudomonadota bacterium]
MFRKIYENLEEAAGALLLAIMAAFAFLNVITRYFIHYSFASTEEIEVAGLVWLTMLGTAAGFRRGIHLGFNLLELRFPDLNKKILFPFSSILTMIAICVLVWVSLLQIRDEMMLAISTEALGIPQWWYTIAIPAGGILILFRIAEALYVNFSKEQL